MIIGVTGENASGKDTVAEYLVKQGFVHYSLSDEIRHELKLLKEKTSRENLIAKGNELRMKFGARILAERVKIRFQKNKNYVITSIRNPHEAQSLMQEKDFTLIAVTALQKKRYEWLKERSRDSDLSSFKDFIKKEKIEHSSDPKKQQLHKVIKMAQVVIKNEGTLEELYDKAQRFLYDTRAKRVRPSFEEIYLELAQTMAKRSTCLRLAVGTVITSTDYRKVLAVGYNGNASGLPNKCDRLIPGNCGCIHSEENAVINCDVPRNVEKIAFVTHVPCVSCAKRLINLGNVKKVYYLSDYRIKDSLDLFKEVGIGYERIKLN